MDLTFENLPRAVSLLLKKMESIEQLIRERNGDPQLGEDKLLTVTEVANLTRLSVPTIYSHVRKASIPVSKKGKRLYFSQAEIFDWIKSGRKKTASEIAAETDSYIRKSEKHH